MQRKKRTVLLPSKKAKAETCSVEPRCPIVAIGASAGGLEVFQQFFDHMPSDSGMAFVLVQHLDPSHDTLMPELLSKHTKMLVRKVVDGQKIQANHVYVIAPNAALTIDGCTLRLKPLPLSAERKLIDQFLRSLAEDQHENVVGIILSGTGTDGTFGLRAIKEQGGFTMAQLPETAKFDSMPRSAISTGYVDYVLPVREMPARIIEYIKHLDVLHFRKGAESIQEEAIKLLPRFFPILRRKTGHDFSRYKQSTLVRRIQRRMQVMYLDSVVKYIRYLRENPEEVDALFKDLLIGVTQFFRDATSFAMLEKKIIPGLFRNKGKDSLVRLWIPGCASGEEAYSFAILLKEHAARLSDVPKIQVFATDLDVEALEFARKAKYSEEVAGQITPERLKKYFKKVGANYEVVDEIREMCIFSPHNLIKDPPFSRLDLISCRNLLIYLESDLQRKLLPLFHYALNPSGYLFLGPSENVAARSELFRALDQKHRIFQRKPTVLHAPVHMPLIDSGQVTRLHSTVAPHAVVPKEQILSRSIERVILEEYSPVSVVINDQGEVVYFSGDTGKFLQPPSGVPTNKIVSMARKNLRLDLRTAVHRAISTKTEVVRKLVLKSGRKIQPINLIVRPLVELGSEPDLYVVMFQESTRSNLAVAEHQADNFSDPEHPIIKQLENELRTTKEELQSTIEELESSNEELKSANEELLSMNEELQSGNEELQTSKEEVQSANDELQHKVEELDAAFTHLRTAQEQRSQLATIVECSQDAIYSMSLDGVILSWNRAAEKIFGYFAEEIIGQNISIFIPPEKRHELERLKLSRPEFFETVRRTKAGRDFYASISWSPIVDLNGQIIGVSSIARDVTEIRIQQAELARSNERFTDIVESIADGFSVMDTDWRLTYMNPRAEDMIRPLGKSRQTVLGKNFWSEFPDLLGTDFEKHYRLTMEERVTTKFELFYPPLDSWFEIRVYPLADNGGVSAFTQDITSRKREEFRLQEQIAIDQFTVRVGKSLASDAPFAEMLDECTQSFVDCLDAAFARIWILDETENVLNLVASSGLYTHLNGDHAQIPVGKFKIGKIASERQPHLTNQVVGDLRVPQQEWAKREGMVAFAGYPLIVEDRLVGVVGMFSRKEIRENTMQSMASVATQLAIGIERKKTEEILRQSEERLLATFNQAAVGMSMVSLNGRFEKVNQRFSDIIGYSLEELTQMTFRDITHPDDLSETEGKTEQLLAGAVNHFAAEKRYVCKGGNIVWSLTTVTILKDAEGKPQRFHGVIEDITQRKHAEEQLREARFRLEATLRAGEIGTWTWDLQKDLLIGDKNLNHLFSIPYSEGVGYPAEAYINSIHPDDTEPVRKAIESAMQREDGIYETDYRVILPDSSIRWLAARGTVERDSSGKPAQMPGVVIDVTERKLAEETVRNSETQLHAMANSIPQLAWMAEPDGNISGTTNGGTITPALILRE